ncbi:MAG: CDP-alcohol phosphatidyltransferase family protein [Gammaproteobacteria bacterium]|nr:CDP-alcohol phosphatidyltransferase family protein [Gammaproteobacteria bacterium]
MSRQLLSQLPNVITLFRIALVPPIAWQLLHAEYRVALVMVFVAGISDGLDGWLARWGNWRSRFGAALDAFADKLLLVVTFSCLWWQDLLPLWLVAVVVARDVYLIVGGLVYNHWFERIDAVEPSRLSKWNTALQIGLAVFTLVGAAWPEFMSAQALFLLNRLVLLTTVITFADYAWTWSLKARDVGIKR